MEIFHSLLAIVLLVSRCAGDDGKAIAASLSATGDVQYTCPDPDTVFPCVCHRDGDMDCSKVESEDQLAQIMGSYFPSTNFMSLTILRNDNLKVLRAGDLGNTTYTLFHIRFCALEEVQAGALSGSYSTAEMMLMPYNRLTSFPWEELSSFTYLNDLVLNDNNISEVSSLTSDTLAYLDLSRNPLGSAEAIEFSTLPAMTIIFLSEIGLTDIIPGTFVGFPNLSTVFLDRNHLVHLPEGAINVPSSYYCFVDLKENNISSVAVNAISGFPEDGVIILWENQLTVLEEEVWRPLLQSRVTLKPNGNPLLCGCDVAWLVRNPTLLEQVDSLTRCVSGELLVNLDPAIFDQC